MGPVDRQPKRALGRGLQALIPQAGAGLAPVAADEPGNSRAVLLLPIEAIQRDGSQPRKAFDESKLQELADSIRTQGLIQPVLVRKEGQGYRLIAGERRWRAAQLAGLKEVPAIVREATESEAFQLALVENLQRTDLNPVEEAEGYRRLIDEFRLTQEQVSQRVGKDRSSVANALRLLGLPDAVKTMLADGAINMGHARALLGVTESSQLVALATKVADDKLSVRETERLVKQRREASPTTATLSRPPATVQTPQMRQVIEDLQRALGTKVRIQDRGGRGTLEVEFFSYEDLDRLIALFRR